MDDALRRALEEDTVGTVEGAQILKTFPQKLIALAHRQKRPLAHVRKGTIYLFARKDVEALIGKLK